MLTQDTPLHDLANALEQIDPLLDRLRGRRLAVFLDYDGTLTPIVDRPEDAVISDEHARRRAARWRSAAASASSAGAIARSSRS